MGNKKGSKRGPYKHHQPPRMCRFPGCTNIFVPMNSNQHYCREDHYSICVICGKKFKVKNLSQVPKTCSKSCQIQLSNAVMFERYGVEHVMQSPEFIEKRKKVCLERLGVEFPMQSKAVKAKARKTSLEHYGVEHPMKCEEVKEKISNTIRSTYGVDWACQTKQCRNSYSHNDSQPNRYLAGLLSYLGIEYELEYPIGRFVYDAHILRTNVVVEMNPTITHNSHMSPWGTPKHEYYHRRKFENAYQSNYICLNIFDWIVPDVLLGKCLWYPYFNIEDLNQPTLHWYRESDGGHIEDISRKLVFDDMISEGYLPVYDSGYSIQLLMKGDE